MTRPRTRREALARARSTARRLGVNVIDDARAMAAKAEVLS